MGTRNAIVKDVSVTDRTAVQIAITNNNGTYGGLQNLDILADFLNDTDGAAFRNEIAFSTTEDFAVGAVDTTNNKITVTNDIPTGTEIKFSSTGVLPTPLEADVSYFAIRVDATHIRVAPTPENAERDVPFKLDDQGSGTHTLDIGDGYTEITWDLYPMLRDQHKVI